MILPMLLPGGWSLSMVIWTLSCESWQADASAAVTWKNLSYENKGKKEFYVFLHRRKNNLVTESTEIILTQVIDFVTCKRVSIIQKNSCILIQIFLKILTEWICSQHLPKWKLQVCLSHPLAQISSAKHTASTARQELRARWAEDREREMKHVHRWKLSGSKCCRKVNRI